MLNILRLLSNRYGVGAASKTKASFLAQLVFWTVLFRKTSENNPHPPIPSAPDEPHHSEFEEGLAEFTSWFAIATMNEAWD